MANYYPPVGFYFEVRFTGVNTRNDASFRDVSGIAAEMGVSEIKEGGENRFAYRVPGRSKYSNLVLRRGLMVSTSDLALWCTTTLERGLDAPIEPKDLDVSLLDPDGFPLMTWNFKRAWPVKWSVSDLQAQENKLVVESLEVAYTYFTTELVEDLGLGGLFDEF